MNKGLMIPTLIGTCLAALLPCLAMADAPSDAAVGQVDAILKFCVKADPRLAPGAETYRKLLTGDASPGARGSEAYEQGYDMVSDALAKVSMQTVLAACSTLASPASSK